MATYYVTFGYKDLERRDGWVEIEAHDYMRAQEIALSFFGRDFSLVYEEADFDKSYFPKGKLS